MTWTLTPASTISPIMLYPHLSPFIIGVNSAVFDVAQSGSFDDMIMDKKKEQISKWKPKHKLRYAWQMTKGLSDIHSVGNIYNCSAIAHTDIKTNQYLWMDGVFKVSRHYKLLLFIKSNDGDNRTSTNNEVLFFSLTT